MEGLCPKPKRSPRTPGALGRPVRRRRGRGLGLGVWKEGAADGSLGGERVRLCLRGGAGGGAVGGRERSHGPYAGRAGLPGAVGGRSAPSQLRVTWWRHPEPAPQGRGSPRVGSKPEAQGRALALGALNPPEFEANKFVNTQLLFTKQEISSK